MQIVIAIMFVIAMEIVIITNMLKIAFNAFKNCKSLKEFHFEKFNDIPDFKSRFNDGISNDYVVIVKNKLYNKWLNLNFEVKLLSISLYILILIDSLENSKIIKTVLLLDKAKKLINDKDFLKLLDDFIKILLKKYNIKLKNINKVKSLILEKQKYELE